MARTSSKSKVVKSIPSSDIGSMVTCYTEANKTGDKYVISQNPLKMQFTLWKCIDEGFEKISTSDNPLDLDELVPYKEC